MFRIQIRKRETITGTNFHGIGSEVWPREKAQQDSLTCA